jgi:hypothetical protein
MVARLDANKALARHDEAQAKQAEVSFEQLGQTLKGIQPVAQAWVRGHETHALNP